MECVSLQDLVAATGGKAVGFTQSDVSIDGVTLDSRMVEPGDLFWAVAGKRHDGHDFAADAVTRGAIGSVVCAAHAGEFTGPRVVVDDTHAALQRFSRWYREQRDALVIGVTGSVGKTTTREMIHAVLSSRYSGTRSPHNFNNHFGLPLSLLEINQEHEFAVIEMGASAPGEIRCLAETAIPEVGVVTAIGPAHLTGFGDEAGIANAKAELVEALPTSGFAVLSGDDPLVRRLAERARCRVILVGETEGNKLRAENVEIANRSIRFRMDGMEYCVHAAGRHHLTGALAAIAIAREIGMGPDDIARGLSSFVPLAGRCRIEEIAPWTVIDDTYNANPRSMQAAAEIIRNWTGPGKRVLVTGDMLELGEQSGAYHRQWGHLAGKAGIDCLLAFGDQAGEVVQGAHSVGMESHRLALCQNFELMHALLDCWLEPGDVVLVKGSRATRMERIIDWMRTRTNEEENIKENLSRPAKRAVA
jgi:UDP-N-acetylmuramoyl-tripeptide--D-alanyl-D-alanine ligase